MNLASLRIESGYWFLASPYTRFEPGIEDAFLAVCRCAAKLTRAGIPNYSPIAETHPVAIHGGIDPLDHGIWLPVKKPLRDAAHGLIVLKLPTWEISYGISEEIEEFSGAGKPIIYLDPEEL